MQVYLSDLHLEDPNDLKFRTFARLLDVESSAGNELFLLGDICEVWIGDDDDGPLAQALLHTLSLAATRTRVHLMHGNRDFLYGEALAQTTGVVLLPDPWRSPDGILLSHGDLFCTDDAEYQQARAFFRNPQWQASVLQQTLAERRQLAAGLRAQSQATNANKAANIMDVNTDAVSQALAEHNSQTLIHGHTHRPGVHRTEAAERYVLGDWDRCGWVLRREPASGVSELRCFGLTGRYEI